MTTPTPHDVVLVNMPFGGLFRPSLGLCQLAAVLRQHGHSVRVLDFTIRLAERIGRHAYVDLSNQRPLTTDQLGEWVFSAALFDEAADDDAYIEQVLRRAHPFYTRGVGRDEAQRCTEVLIDNVRQLRRMAPGFIAEASDEVRRWSPRVVGFGSVFQQHLASLALARRLAEPDAATGQPPPALVLGGANCEGPMGAETARCFPFLAAVVSGEGEVVLPQIVRRVLAGESLEGLQGVFLGGRDHFADRASPAWRGASSPASLDALPLPDYGDYLDNLRASSLDQSIAPLLLFETSRGCWWGAKSHCTFCGLNAQSMAFRSKSAQRVLDQLATIAREHPGATVSIVDNILDMKYFRDVVPRLAELDLGLDLFYEVKSNLRKEQIRALREAGINGIQPGIESFSSPVLDLMGKGVRGIQNVQLLKWCHELGVTPYWNVLWGFPGESPGEYERMAALVPSLVHLEPPMSCGRIRLDRFSPNFERAREHGFVQVKPYPAAAHVYPTLSDEARANLSYYFTFEYAEPRDLAAYTADLAGAVDTWKRAHAASDLFFVDDGQLLQVWDLRPSAVDPLTLIDGVERLVALETDAVTTVERLVARLASRQASSEGSASAAIESARIERALTELERRRLLMREGDSVLFLAIPVGEYRPRPAVQHRWSELAAALAPQWQPALASLAVPA